MAAEVTMELEIIDRGGLDTDRYVKDVTEVKATFHVPESWTISSVRCTGELWGATASGGTNVLPFRFRESGSNVYVLFEIRYTRTGENGEPVSGTYGFGKYFEVLPYEKPAVIPAVAGAADIVCRRCDESGTISQAGTGIRLTAARRYTPVMDGSVQLNFCSLRYRIREESARDYGEWTALLEADDLTRDDVDVVLNLGLSISSAYSIQVCAEDTTGERHLLTKPIPAARTPLHLGRGGRNVGLGGFCDYSHENAVDVFWDTWFHQNVNFGGTVHLGNIGVRTVFEDEDSGWSSGQALGDAFPEADLAAAKQGTVFLAVLRKTMKVDNVTAYAVFAIPCYRIPNGVTEDNQQKIAGSGCGWFSEPDDTDYLCSFWLEIRGDTYTLYAMEAVGGEQPTTCRREGDNGTSVQALYVLL